MVNGLYFKMNLYYYYIKKEKTYNENSLPVGTKTKTIFRLILENNGINYC